MHWTDETQYNCPSPKCCCSSYFTNWTATVGESFHLGFHLTVHCYMRAWTASIGAWLTQQDVHKPTCILGRCLLQQQLDEADILKWACGGQKDGQQTASNSKLSQLFRFSYQTRLVMQHYPIVIQNTGLCDTCKTQGPHTLII